MWAKSVYSTFLILEWGWSYSKHLPILRDWVYLDANVFIRTECLWACSIPDIYKIKLFTLKFHIPFLVYAVSKKISWGQIKGLLIGINKQKKKRLGGYSRTHPSVDTKICECKAFMEGSLVYEHNLHIFCIIYSNPRWLISNIMWYHVSSCYIVLFRHW